MTGSGAGVEPEVETVSAVCGCAGKTSLSKVVRPGRYALRRRLRGSNVRLVGELDAALLPRTDTLARRTLRFSVRDGSLERDAPDDGASAGGDGEWCLAAVFGGPELTTPGQFADWMRALCDRLAGGGPLTLGKGHSVQVSDARRTRLWVEGLRPVGSPRPGYCAANVDAVHAFPEMDPVDQAAVAVRHALNDCYAQAATTDRVIRPLLGVPAGSATGALSAARRWYRAALPEGVALLAPRVVPHGGRGWLFGATATAVTSRRPPVRSAAIDPGDVVLLHRPLGALALYAQGVDTDRADYRNRARAALATDNAPVARRIAETCPGFDGGFDPERHVKYVTDISGPGLGGLARVAARAGVRFRIDALPLVDGPALRAARRAWLVPDVTVETNGPLAVVGRRGVIEGLAEALLTCPGADPVVVAEAIPPDGDTEEGDGIVWDLADPVEVYVEGADCA